MTGKGTSGELFNIRIITERFRDLGIDLYTCFIHVKRVKTNQKHTLEPKSICGNGQRQLSKMNEHKNRTEERLSYSKYYSIGILKEYLEH